MSHSKAASHAVPRPAAKRVVAGAAKRSGGLRGGASKPASGGGKTDTETWQPPYMGLYRASPLERIAMIKKGILASQVKDLLAALRMGQSVGFKALKLSTATVNKKAKKGEFLPSDESERVIGLARLVGQVESMVEESGDGSAFDACAWMARWMTGPVRALGGAHPIDLIDTMEGQALISNMLAQMQSGVYG